MPDDTRPANSRGRSPRRRAALAILAVTSLMLVIAEIALRLVAPVSDPFESVKARRYVNQYIRSAFPRNLRFKTEAEPGLPGLSGPHQFTTNNAGFRGDSLVQPKPAGEYRIFVVGGSTVEGLYLDDTETITAALQRTLTGVAPGRTVKVYNAGKSGDKSDDHISMLAHRLVHFQPDLLVVMMGLNDLRASLAGFDYTHFDPRPAFTSAEAPARLGLRSLLTMVATEFQLPRHLYYAAKRVRPRSAQEIQETISLRSQVRTAAEKARRLPVATRVPHGDTTAFRHNVETLIGIAAGQHVPLVLVTHPVTWNTSDTVITRWQWMRAVGDTVFAADRMDAAMAELNAITRTEAMRSGVPVYDLAGTVSRSTSQFYDDTHFNVAGAAAAGDGLGRFLAGLALPGLTRSENSGRRPPAAR